MKKALILACLFTTFASCGGEKQGRKETKTDEAKKETSPPKEAKTADKASQKENRKKALQSINGYYEGLSKGDYEAATSNFSKKTAQWITLKNTNPKAIATEARRFLGKKKDVNYTVNEKSLTLHGNIASIQVRQQWTGYDTTVEVEIMFDKDAKIVSYIERKVLKKLKSTSTNNLTAYLKKLPEKKLPFQYSYEDTESISELGMKILVSPEDISFLKESMQQGIMFMQACFWYTISDDVVGIVTLSGGRIQDYSLTTFNRKTGKKIGEERIGSMGRLSGMESSTSFTFDANFKIVSVVSTLSPTFDEEGNQKDNGKTEESVYEYGVTQNGDITKL